MSIRNIVEIGQSGIRIPRDTFPKFIIESLVYRLVRLHSQSILVLSKYSETIEYLDRIVYHNLNEIADINDRH